MKAIGFIETKGLVAAIESADAMLKAAHVSLMGKNLVGAGLVTITVTGEVSAVQASVSAGASAVRRISGGILVSEHVIARPDTEVGCVIMPDVQEKAAETPSLQETEKALEKTESPRHELSQLKKMNVSKLRRIARTFDGFPISRQEIKFARKKELIEAIKNAYTKES